MFHESQLFSHPNFNFSFRKVKIVVNSVIRCSFHHFNRQHLVLFDPSSTKTNILTAM